MSMDTSRFALQERRGLVMELTALGLPGWLIAERMQISHRTVQRYQHAERNGIPARNPASYAIPDLSTCVRDAKGWFVSR